MRILAFTGLCLIANPTVSLHVSLPHTRTVAGAAGPNSSQDGGEDSWYDSLLGQTSKTLPDCLEGVPPLTTDIIAELLSVCEASYRRKERMRFLQAHMHVSHHGAKQIYGHMHRRCKPISPPPPGCDHKKAVAIVMSGQTRSFLDPQVVQYWQNVFKTIRDTQRVPVLFAVLDEVSTSAVRANQTPVTHNDSVKVIKETLTGMEPNAQFSFLSGDPTMKGHALHVTDPTLQKILAPKGPREANKLQMPFELGYMKLVIGLDMLLKYEKREPRACFSHVLRTRPDYVFLNWQDASYLQTVWAQLTDVVYMINDVLAMMPREHAGTYFTSFVMHRALKNWTQLGQIHLVDTFLRKEDRWAAILQPSTWVAYNGVIFAGHGLEVDNWLGLARSGEIKYDGLGAGYTHGFIVREEADKGACLGSESTLVNHTFTLPRCSTD